MVHARFLLQTHHFLLLYIYRTRIGGHTKRSRPTGSVFVSISDITRNTMNEPRTTLEISPEGVAIITLVNPPVNALHPKGT